MPKHLKKSKHSITKFSVAALLLAVPLYPKFPFISIPGSQVALRLEDILLGAIFCLWIVFNYSNFNKLFKNNIVRAIFLFWIIGAISVMSGILITKTVISHIAFLHWARRIEYMLAFFIGFTSIKSKSDLAFYIRIILITLLIAFVYGVGQKHFHWPIISTQNQEYAKGIALRYVPGGHIPSAFAGHYDLSSYLILILPLVVSLFAADKKIIGEVFYTKKILAAKMFLLFTYLSSLWLLVNAASRISIVSYLLAVSLVLLFARRIKLIVAMLAVSIIFVGMTSNLITRYTRILKVVVEKVSHSVVHEAYASSLEFTPKVLSAIEDRSTSIRLNVEWPRAIRAFKKNPLLGTGYSSITLATDNDYLRMLGEVGLLGSLAFLSLFLLVFKTFLYLCPIPPTLSLRHIFSLSIFSALPGIFLNMVFIDILEASKFAIMFWLLLGMAVSLNIKKNV